MELASVVQDLMGGWTFRCLKAAGITNPSIQGSLTVAGRDPQLGVAERAVLRSKSGGNAKDRDGGDRMGRGGIGIIAMDHVGNGCEKQDVRGNGKPIRPGKVRGFATTNAMSSRPN